MFNLNAVGLQPYIPSLLLVFFFSHDTPPHVSKLDLRGLMSNREQQHSERLLAEQAKAAAKKDEVRKWMKEKRKERLSDYIEHRKDLAQKEHSPWRQKSTLSNQEIKENLKQRETLKALVVIRDR